MHVNKFPTLDGTGLRIAVIASRFNQELTDAMLADCLDALTSVNVAKNDIETLRVPGSFELPVAAATCAAQKTFDAIVCLGVIIKGETTHDQYIANAVANGLMEIGIRTSLPVIFGVLTTNNLTQAEARALGGHKKGWEAGLSAVEMGHLLNQQRVPLDKTQT